MTQLQTLGDMIQEITMLNQLQQQATQLLSLTGQEAPVRWMQAFKLLHTLGQLPPDIPPRLSVLSWYNLLSRYPEFAEGLPEAGGHQPPWDQFSKLDWVELLWSQPQFVSKMPKRIELSLADKGMLETRYPDIQLP